MLTTQKRWAVVAAACLLAVCGSGSGVMAQDAAPTAPEADASLQSMWEDFLHFVKIANTKAAESWGKAIIDKGAKPQEIYKLSVKYPDSLLVLARGARLENMKPLTDKISKLIEDGYLQMRKDPAEIARSINMLGGTVKQFDLGKKQIYVSGEYALPQLLQKLMADDTPPILRTRIIVALPTMGTQIARGLSVALTAEEPELLQVVANTLGRLQSPVAVPRLKQLTQREKLLPKVRRAAVAALKECGGSPDSTAEAFYAQAEKYYYEAESLMPDKRYEMANVWYWNEGLLSYKPVPRPIFNEIMTMRMARLALQHDAEMNKAVSLWLAAHIRKEVELPSGTTDPTRGASQPAAKYYALASPAAYLQDALGTYGLKDGNPAVAIPLIQALGATAGAKSLVQDTPLVEAMNYQDRRVRFLAAETLANARPDQTFPGSEVVLWVLNEAIRQSGTMRALLMVADSELSNTLKSALRGAGVEVLAETDVNIGLSKARAQGGVDMVVIAKDPEPSGVMAMLRADPSFHGTPVILAAKGLSYRDMAAADKKAVTVDPAGGADAMKSAIAAAGKLGGTPLAPELASQWAVRACQAVRMLGMTRNAVLDANRAQPALISAMGDKRPEVQTAAAGALAVLPSAEAQQAIVGLALKSTDEQVRIAAFQAASESVRTFGRQVTDEQAQAIKGVVAGKGSPALLNAAAQLLGSLNLPSRKVRELITDTAGMD